jgi:hypothetical protein
MSSFFSVISLLLFSYSAYAIPVLWELPSGVLGDPSTGTGVIGVDIESGFPSPLFVLEGSFVYDADTGVYSDIEITRSDGGRLFTETSCYFACSDETGLGFAFREYTETGSFFQEYHRLLFDADLTNAGGTVSIMSPSSWIRCDHLAGCGGGDIQQGESYMLGGASIVGTVVPVPAAVWLFGSALAGLGWMRRKQPV